jgi:hypothetical protein
MSISQTVNNTFKNSPAGGDDFREGDDKIREFKSAWMERCLREHELDSASQANHGLHLEGSAVAYYGGSTPSNRPDGSAALGSNDYDKGRLFVDTSANMNTLKVWDGSTFTTVGLDSGAQSIYGEKTFTAPLNVDSGVTVSGAGTFAGNVEFKGNTVTFNRPDASGVNAVLYHISIGVATEADVFTHLENVLGFSAGSMGGVIGYFNAYILTGIFKPDASTYELVYVRRTTGESGVYEIVSGSSDVTSPISMLVLST